MLVAWLRYVLLHRYQIEYIINVAFKQSMSVRFCSDDCQLKHWKGGHMYECKQIARERNVFILVNQDSLVHDTVVGRAGRGLFCPPSDVEFGEVFTVKIQYLEEEGVAWIYDKMKQCEFFLSLAEDNNSNIIKGNDKTRHASTRKGSHENNNDLLLGKIQLQSKTSNGEFAKIYVSAVFEDETTCKLYINQTKIKTW
jgi:hypothetical protein